MIRFWIINWLVPFGNMSNKSLIQSRLMGMLLRYGGVTRPECVRELGVRAASLLEAIDTLKHEGLIQEPERHGKRTGRKAPRLVLSPDYLWCVGMDFQEDKVLGVVLDMGGEVRYEATVRGGRRRNADECWQEILLVLEELRKKCGVDWSRVKGIGFADPGLVDIAKGVSLRAVNLPGWQNVQTKALLEKHSGLPVGVWPECAVSTYMEYLQRGRALQGSLFYLGMGTGIGGGYIRDGECFFGDHNLAMEVGHVVVNPNGPLCQCGNRGCLEAIAGRNGIFRRIQETLASGVNTSLELSHFSLAKFTECVRTDKAAHVIANEICESIGCALSTVVTLLNPSCIVLRGELTGLGTLLLETVKRVLTANCFPAALEHLRLEISTLAPSDTARGAALMMRNRLLAEV